MQSFIAACLRRTGKLWRGAESVTTREPELVVAKPDHNGQQMGRHCLVCHERFLSAWTGERICSRCRRTGEDSKPAV